MIACVSRRNLARGKLQQNKCFLLFHVLYKNIFSAIIKFSWTKFFHDSTFLRTRKYLGRSVFLLVCLPAKSCRCFVCDWEIFITYEQLNYSFFRYLLLIHGCHPRAIRVVSWQMTDRVFYSFDKSKFMWMFEHFSYDTLTAKCHTLSTPFLA